MSRKVEQVIPIGEQNILENGLVVGLIDAVHDDGSVFVSLPGSSQRIRARTTFQLSEFRDDPEQLVGCDVLLSVAGFRCKKAIIVGLLNDTLWSTVDKQASSGAAGDGKIDVKVDGKSITFNAEKEIVLTCGRSSIALKRDGKIIIKGMRVTTRAAKSNKIKGASVNIN